jgi:hypothetical protein
VFSVVRRAREESGRRRRKERVCELRVFLIFYLLWFVGEEEKRDEGSEQRKEKRL